MILRGYFNHFKVWVTLGQGPFNNVCWAFTVQVNLKMVLIYLFLYTKKRNVANVSYKVWLWCLHFHTHEKTHLHLIISFFFSLIWWPKKCSDRTSFNDSWKVLVWIQFNNSYRRNQQGNPKTLKPIGLGFATYIWLLFWIYNEVTINYEEVLTSLEQILIKRINLLEKY